MKARVLVVEDNQLNFELISDLLEAEEFTVLQARTAEEGLRLARDASPDLILMDISLPGMDGLAAAKKLKADPATRHLPVVALTAHAMRGDKNAALAAGCDGYLTKPIDTRIFPAQVAGFIPPLRNQVEQTGTLSENPLKATAHAHGRVPPFDDETPNRVLLRDSIEAPGDTDFTRFESLKGANTAAMVPHILFVDDEAPIRELLSISFRKKGWNVTTAVTTADARAMAAKFPFTLAILDVHLAGDNGLELLDFLKTNYPNMPVIIFTGLTDEDLVDKALAKGASGFMLKSESLNGLYLEVCKHLPQN